MRKREKAGKRNGEREREEDEREGGRERKFLRIDRNNNNNITKGPSEGKEKE